MAFIQMAGFPGSGKSTLALEIAKHTGAVIVDHDVSKSAILVKLAGKVEDRLLGAVAYDVDFALIDFYLAQGQMVILDSPCYYEEMVEKGLALAQKHNTRYRYIECVNDDFNEINRRLKARERKMSQIAEVQNETGFLKMLSQSKKPMNVECLSVETNMPLHTYINEVLAYLEK